MPTIPEWDPRFRREIELNSAFIRTFRDTGDADYILARMAYRMRLIPQFHWSSLQAIEKYLKCILTLNRVEAKMGHNLAAALEQIARSLRFQVKLSEMTREFIEHLDTYGRFRYLETPYHSSGIPLVQLDRAVWELRRYCQAIDRSRIEDEIEAEKRLLFEIQLIEAAEDCPPNRFTLFGGFLESVVRTRQHPARSALIWMNFYFGPRARHQVSIQHIWTTVNSPLTLNPELVDDMVKYIRLDKRVADAYRERVQEQRSRKL